MMNLLIKTDNFLGSIANACGMVATLALILMLVNVAFDVILRYIFNDVSIGLQELEWHLFALSFLLGVPYAMRRDGHVRVDIIYESRSDRVKALINLCGVFLLAIPIFVLIIYYGYFFAVESYQLGEGSGDPGGLPHRWIIKSMIAVSATFALLGSLSMASQALRILLLNESYNAEDKEQVI
jgi:TRAP-type mannitol/chloroaromatic compound transport system permease small subunit